MKKRRLKSFAYSPPSRMTKSEKMQSQIFEHFSGRAPKDSRLTGQSQQAALLLLEASRQDVLDLVSCVLHGWTYELDESGRLWVYHPDVRIEDVW